MKEITPQESRIPMPLKISSSVKIMSIRIPPSASPSTTNLSPSRLTELITKATLPVSVYIVVLLFITLLPKFSDLVSFTN